MSATSPSVQSIIEATPRRRKKAYASPLNSPLPPRNRHPGWPRLGNRILTRPVQLRAAIKLLEGFDIFVVAATGAGKSLIFALVALAATLLGLKRIVIVICPLKALQMDQVCSILTPNQ
ncbi:hypothetical protein PHLGIDRAFT_20572 [Phlebiopsis gigantea 11061_1 CR5-6]|uniref:DNA 3'-5' helicase n=1 Tax=Phlebiopsis gigantea (strain 11061_1 CR5-6) TaxID=745531 RepID=A0A0C3RQA2_PHLG1|nr:hypothetical protein PHLGIDRAFT_20572 [Phlebiopsis gigantea 11061_1 CR5-6]